MMDERDARAQAMGATIMELTGKNIDLVVRVMMLEAELKALRAPSEQDPA